jgi:hypothetical protein
MSSRFDKQARAKAVRLVMDHVGVWVPDSRPLG